MTKKQFLQFVSFTAIALLMIFGTGQFLRDKDTTIAGFYSEPKNTIDVIAVGSSHVNSGVIPAVFWKEYGINAHNVFSWSQPIWISYHYIKEALRFQKPKVAVVDLYGMMYGNSYEQPKEIDEVNYRNSFSIDPSLNFLQMIQTVADCGIELKNPIDFLNPVRYHTAWKSITEKNFTVNTHRQYSYLKGYGIQSGKAFAQKCDASAKVQARAPYDTAIKYLDKIVALSKKQHFDLVFTMLPYEFAPQEREIFAWLAQYAAENNIPFLNYCEGAGDRIGFDYGADFFDPHHANYTGAYKISTDLASFINTNYSAKAVPSPLNAKQLNKDADMVYRVLKVNSEMSEDITSCFARLKQDENAVLIADISPQIGGALSEELEKALTDIGISPTKQGITLCDNGNATMYKDKLEYNGLTFSNSADENKILFKDGKDYFPKEAIEYKFCIYDKVLQRPTFYFYYSPIDNKLIIKDFPAI